MNPVLILQQLLPVVTPLLNLINQIRSDHPDAWAQVSPDFQKALDDLRAAEPKA